MKVMRLVSVSKIRSSAFMAGIRKKEAASQRASRRQLQAVTPDLTYLSFVHILASCYLGH